MTDIEWSGSFSKDDRNKIQSFFASLGIEAVGVRMVMQCITSSHNLLIVTSGALITAFVPRRRKDRSRPAVSTGQIPFGELSQVAYKSRSTRDDDLQPRRLYALEGGGQVRELGLLLASGNVFERLAAVLDPIPVAVDGKLVQLSRPQVTGSPGMGPFAPMPIDLPIVPSSNEGPSAPRLFISHASEDGRTAVELTAELESNGVGTWLATRDIDAGQNYAEQIHDAIVNSSHLVVLLSPESVASVHVQREVNLALDSGKSLLPVVVSSDPSLMMSLPAAWRYWLGVVQVVPYTAPAAVVRVLLRTVYGGR